MKSLLFGTKFATLLYLFLGATCLGGSVKAEGGCAPGFYPMPAPSGQGIVGCAPIPGYGAGPATPPPPRWVSRWGAIATDETTASLGSVTGESSKERAIQAALAHCKINGGTKCKLAIAYDNQCAAMTVGENSFNITNEATLDKAVDSVLAYCKATDTNCRVYHTTCSFPEQIP